MPKVSSPLRRVCELRNQLSVNSGTRETQIVPLSRGSGYLIRDLVRVLYVNSLLPFGQSDSATYTEESWILMDSR